jgi:hypothetical protein
MVKNFKRAKAWVKQRWATREARATERREKGAEKLKSKLERETLKAKIRKQKMVAKPKVTPSLMAARRGGQPFGTQPPRRGMSMEQAFGLNPFAARQEQMPIRKRRKKPKYKMVRVKVG